MSGQQLNVGDPAGAVNMWMRVATLLMLKMGAEHIEISPAEIEAMGRKNLAITTSFHMTKGIRINLVDIEDLKRLANNKHV